MFPIFVKILTTCFALGLYVCSVGYYWLFARLCLLATLVCFVVFWSDLFIGSILVCVLLLFYVQILLYCFSCVPFTSLFTSSDLPMQLVWMCCCCFVLFSVRSLVYFTLCHTRLCASFHLYLIWIFFHGWFLGFVLATWILFIPPSSVSCLWVSFWVNAHPAAWWN